MWGRKLSGDFKDQGQFGLFRGVLDIASNAIGLPPAGTIASTVRQFSDIMMQRKIAAFLNALDRNSDSAELRSQTLENLRREHGQEYFDEALFSSIDKSDSSLRASYLGSLLGIVSSRKIPLNHFWPVKRVLEEALMSDLMFVPELLQMERMRSAKNDHTFREHPELAGLNEDEADEKANDIYWSIRDRMTRERAVRFQALGLMLYDSVDEGHESEVFAEIAKSVLLCVDEQREC